MAPSNGMAVLSNGQTTFGSTVTYSCNLGFTLVGPFSRECNAEGVWSDTAPICDGTKIVAALCES